VKKMLRRTSSKLLTIIGALVSQLIAASASDDSGGSRYLEPLYWIIPHSQPGAQAYPGERSSAQSGNSFPAGGLQFPSKYEF
jgi:hypothetical protein